MSKTQSHFQVYWYELELSIKHKATLIEECTRGLANLLLSTTRSIDSLKPHRKYVVNEKENSSDSDAVTILRNVSGSFESGQLSAVMGPSGAGKTSLLNILSRRRESGFTGQVRVSGTSKHVSINAIPQHDHLPECFTVRENLTFAARLKNADQNHATNVQRVGGHLGLSECLDTRTKNLSGGQQKRLAIAQELLSQPGILILDEPTSGLDSLTCLKTLSVLKTLAVASREGEIDPIAIVLTIHQPQQEAFNLFDKVYVMANGGTVIYDGPPGQCERFVERHAGLRMPSADYNPASFLVEIASGEYGHEPIEALARQVRLEHAKIRERASSKNLEGSTLSMGIIERASSVDSLKVKGQHSLEVHFDPKLSRMARQTSSRFLAKTRILTERFLKATWRNPGLMLAKSLLCLLMPFCLSNLMDGKSSGKSNACPQFKTEYSLKRLLDSDEYISAEVSEELIRALENTAMFFNITFTLFSATTAVMALVFALDMRSSLKEFHNGWYSMGSYIFARLIYQAPIDLLLIASTLTTLYIITEQDTGTASEMPDAYRILITTLGVFIGASIGQLVGMLFGAIFMNDIGTAIFTSQGVMLPFCLVSGIIVRTRSMTSFVKVLSMTSIYKHCLEIAFIARYGWNVCGCRPEQFGHGGVRLSGVPDKLRDFVMNWLESHEESQEVASNKTDADSDIFQMVARQLFLYNTYGLELTTCEQVVPYEMYSYNLKESDLPFAFGALISIYLFLLITLILVVKHVTSH